MVKRANERNQLMLSRKQEAQIAQEAFRETGNRLQERRHLDMVYNFGSHLTDLYKPGNPYELAFAQGVCCVMRIKWMEELSVMHSAMLNV